jgi:hypothetical protein
MKSILYSLALFFLQATILWAETGAGTKIDVFPPIPYEQATVYINLGFFWAGIIGLIIILRLKLKELERTQKMEQEEAGREAPLLE